MNAVAANSSSAQESALLVNGMDCASCVAHVQKAAQRTGAVQACEVNLARGRAVVQFDPARITAQQIADAITDAGYPTALEQPDQATADIEEQRLHRQMHHTQAWFTRALVGIALWFPLEAIHWTIQLIGRGHTHGAPAGPGWMIWFALATSTASILYVGSGFYRSAWKAARRLTSNMDTLIALGATVAYCYSLAGLIGFLAGWWGQLPQLYFMEATGLLALISLGHWLEARARQSAGSAIHDLLQLAPATAMKLQDSGDDAPAGAGSGNSSQNSQSQAQISSGFAAEVPVAQLEIGDMVLVRPGDRVPIDGVVLAGRSSIDESMISGEPLPVSRGPGDQVIGGTVNQDGALRVRVSRVGSETALSQIVRLVEHAQASKPAIQRLADRVAAVFVPSVLTIALLTGVWWYAWGVIHHWNSAATWGQVALTVCSVLIIACPCALGLAVPAALMVGTGRGARKGILIRDIDALQSAETIDTVVLDKTGTITRGKPIVGRIESFNGLPENEVLRLAAAAEQFSEHPLAKAIVSAARDRGLKIPDPQTFNNEPGYGVSADIEGKKVLVGSEAMMLERATGFKPAAPPHRASGTMVHVALHHDGAAQVVGAICLTDQVKPDSAAAIDELHKLGLRTVLLTGDNLPSARDIARQTGIDDVRAQVKPDGKAQAIRDLQNQQPSIMNRKSVIAMVGDGINDAPALAQADLGIAIGSGSDIAKETGGIVLVGGSLHGIAVAIRLSRATMSKIRQNLFFAFLYNVLAIPIAAGVLYPLGIMLNPYIAAAAMALSDVTVLGNALLLRRARID